MKNDSEPTQKTESKVKDLNHLGAIIDHCFEQHRKAILFEEVISAIKSLHGLSVSFTDLMSFLDTSTDFDWVRIKDPQSGAFEWHIYDRRDEPTRVQATK